MSHKKTADKLMSFTWQFSTINLNLDLTLALRREISICSVFLLHNNSANANPLLSKENLL